MPERFRIAVAQLNPTVGDISGNCHKAHRAWCEGREATAQLVILSEMFVSGYQTQDLVVKGAFLKHCADAINQLAVDCADGPALAIGAPHVDDGQLYNAYFFLHRGRIAHVERKTILPNYSVFDEQRVFCSNADRRIFELGGVRIGTLICEDAWHEGPARNLGQQRADIILVPNGSPYHRGKFEERQQVMAQRVQEAECPLIYVNLVGGQDDQVFDGASFALSAGAELLWRLPLLAEQIDHFELVKPSGRWQICGGKQSRLGDHWERDYHVLVTALRDYLTKSGFKQVLIGLSGGVDSALVTTIAVDALGAENVHCVMMPSEFTSSQSLNDAKAIVETLGCAYDCIPIDASRSTVTATLKPFLQSTESTLTDENIQSRLRGLLLMALSNNLGKMLLTTGNKSEVAVGYATIYGDMVGGYNPIKDLYKTSVFAMCEWRNGSHHSWMKGPKGIVVPNSVIAKPPTAELRANQADSDTLPDYECLDKILEILIDRDGSVDECVACGFELDMVRAIEHRIYASEYKRFQSAPGPKVSQRAFWLDRRYPIVNRWREQNQTQP
ncbi:MAG: NAD+ synthase [Aestuariivita sp.]|nr:NAD+ synthase [Aestuariivita sp.]MCY4201344.1 NAD+ synthase [Aestuariivita sp.]